MSVKIRMTVINTTEYELDDKLYPPCMRTPEQMLAIDLERIDQNPSYFWDMKSDVFFNVTGRVIVPEINNQIGE